ncbi:MAG: DUF2723 domain-containing protein [Bacteroidetes bacterium]|jgi:hypothetical protein|nr:DUF2723 domain-containing protein [Bacteroidota bacterium]MBT6687703.1 DUF2723 domain-containing protein [Bacteroidota bacterium]MBT7143626.1 DUF2723 domain-containing protein [Bacteroidota bacterium]MBT7490527.1 DUF2723 domain-containing protein [Bacteroidota bacterium]
MKQFRLLNVTVGWLSFLIAAITYILTIEPTTSFWDCGEFITTAFKLQVGHPPGAPTFMIMARFFTMFTTDVTQVAKMVNIMSGLASAFTILFLFWTITHIAKKIIIKSDNLSIGQTIAVLGAGFVGALAYTFSDTFWFSAVEAEVYSSSSLFTAVVFWAILKWENVADQKYSNRWIILIAYLVGLSIGVHLLNLLAIPAIVFVYYYKKYQVSQKGIVYALIISIVMLGVIMYGIIPGVVIVASWFELLFVNMFGLPYNTGVMFYILLLLGSIIFGIIYTSKKKKVLLNTIIVSFTAILIGYSSFSMVVIRSLANPPMDQNNPETVFGLLSYLNREQYGDRPLFHGQHYNAPIVDEKDDKETLTQVDGRYEVTNVTPKYIYDDRFLTLFPRMYSAQAKHVKEYKYWGKVVGKPIKAQGRDGETKVMRVPTFGENLRFFFKYQIGHMYLRYFMWNFAGRQNDIQGHGDVLKGNWISGIPLIDDARLGPQDMLPESFKNNKANNKLYFLPLILGIMGIVYLYMRNRKDFWVVFLLFIFTGLAIVVYLNQYPIQPRERDYAYAGSFYAFAIWIGLGVLWIYELLNKYLSQKVSAVIATIACFLLVPAHMLSQNWDDHDRSNRYTARDFAHNYLESCAPNAILFTNGDNDTFPLWYAQEVEGIRTDVRVVNLSYLSTNWYIDQMIRQSYESAPVPFTLKPDQYIQGKRDYVPMFDRTKEYVDLKKVMQFVGSESPKTKYSAQGKDLDYIPTKKLSLAVDSAKVVSNGTVKLKDADKIVSSIDWDPKKSYLLKNDLMTIDLLTANDWDRPVYFAITVGSSSYLKLEPYFQVEGLAYRLVPIKTKDSNKGKIGRMDTEIVYENMMNKFKWGGINDPRVYLDENNQRMLMNFRSNFARLALALFEEGKKEKSLEVADRCIELMPHKFVPYNYFNLQLSEVYYKLGEIEKGNEIIALLADVSEEKINYFFSLDREDASFFQDELKRDLYMMQEFVKVAERNKQNEMKDDLEKRFSILYSIYSQGS